MRFTNFSATFQPRAPIATESALPALLGNSHNTEEIPYRVCILLVRPSLSNFSNETWVSSFVRHPQLLPDDGLFLALLPVEVCSVRKAGPPHHLPAGQGHHSCEQDVTIPLTLRLFSPRPPTSQPLPLEWNVNLGSWHPHKAKALVWILKVGGRVRSFKVVLQICVRSHAAHLMDVLWNQGSKCREQGSTGSSGSSVVCGTD